MKKQKTIQNVILPVLIISSVAMLVASAQTATPTVTTVPNSSSTVNGTVNSGTNDQTVMPTSATVPGMPNTAMGNDEIAYYLTLFMMIALFETVIVAKKLRTKSANAKN